MKNKKPYSSKDPKKYHALKNQLFFVGLSLNIALLILIFFSGFSVSIRDFCVSIFGNTLAFNAVYIVIFLGIMYSVHFPLNIIEGFVLEHHFGLSNQSFLAWLKDDIKKALLSGIVLLIMIEAVYVFLGRFPQSWWIYATFFWLFINLILARLAPQVIIPIFFKYSDIDDPVLKERILGLFRRCRISISGVYAVNFSSKTKKANAFLCGLGNNRRVVLSDNLIEHFSHGEIEAVTAHEIGHYRNHDILKITAVSSFVTLFSFYAADIVLKTALLRFGSRRLDDIAFFPVIALVFIVIGLIVMPILNAYSRFLETNADAYSLTVSKNPDNLISAFLKLGDMNLAEFEPSRFIEFLFYDHPPLAKRIRFVQNFKKQ